MSDINKARGAQQWLMEYYNEWIPLDKCLELVRHMDRFNEAEEQKVEDLVEYQEEQIKGLG